MPRKSDPWQDAQGALLASLPICASVLSRETLPFGTKAVKVACESLLLAAPVNLFSVAWSAREVVPFGTTLGYDSQCF